MEHDARPVLYRLAPLLMSWCYAKLRFLASETASQSKQRSGLTPTALLEKPLELALHCACAPVRTGDERMCQM